MDKLRDKVNEIIFGHHTKEGKLFDVVLLWIILISVLIVILESIPSLHINYYRYFFYIEWIVTILFTLEYIVRIWSTKTPFRYIFSFSISY